MWIFFFLLPFSLFSAPIGNPSTPALLEDGFFISDESWSNPQAGYEGDFLFQKRLKAQANNEITQANLKGVSQIGEIAWCIRERFLLQLELGKGEFKWRWIQSGDVFEGRSRDGLIWSGSGKLILLEAKETSFALDGHVGGWDWMEGPVTVDGILQSEVTQSKLRYWQFGVGVSHKVALFSPYLGLAINQTRFKVLQLSGGNGDFQAWYTVGPFLGCSLTNGSRFFLNLEWRGWFEEGLSLAGQIRF